MSRILISRMGAFGDCLIVTPLIRYLHARGDEVVMLTSDQGLAMFANNPHLAKTILHVKDSVPSDQLDQYFEAVRQAEECDTHIGLSESIEVNIALHPNSPRYKYPKHERRNVNYYEETFRIAQHALEQDFFTPMQLGDPKYFHPELFFTDQERTALAYEFQPWEGKRVILWGLSGSALNKCYPHVHEVIRLLLARHDDVLVVTVGDEMCQILEFPFKNKPFRGRVICKSGKWTMRQSALACQAAAVVVSPDTGLLHAAGCADNPKVGLLGHTTHEEICKHFANDYCAQAEGVGCSPCHQIHYQSSLTCNLDEDDSRAALCMSKGLPAERVLARVEEALMCNEVRSVQPNSLGGV